MFLAARVALSGGSELWPWASFEAAGARLAFTVQPWAGCGPVCVQSLGSHPLSKNWEKPQKRAFLLSPPEWILVPQPLKDTSHKMPLMTWFGVWSQLKGFWQFATAAISKNIFDAESTPKET